MRNLIYDIELKEINSQLDRALVKKNDLIKKFYREYEYYLQLVRDLLLISVKKGLNGLYCGPSTINTNLNSPESYSFIEDKINHLVNLKLPLITIEQLKISEINYSQNKEEKFLNLVKVASSLKDYQKDYFELDDHIIFEGDTIFSDGNFPNNSEYYRYSNNETFISLDLDKNIQDNYTNESKDTEKNSAEKILVTSSVELLDDENFDKLKSYEKDNSFGKYYFSKDQSIDNFNLMENALNDLLLNLSYEINLELFESNFIKNIISVDTFKFLLNKNFMAKHPHPFIIEFDLNINKIFKEEVISSSISLINITTVELEFKHLNISSQRNKINELKKQFQFLIKKEKYWKQKEIYLNKINR